MIPSISRYAQKKGDVIAAYADTTKSKTVLGWTPKYSLQNALKSAWKWELALSKKE